VGEVGLETGAEAMIRSGGRLCVQHAGAKGESGQIGRVLA
jgi:hypothetical protein